jgi:hypothetical protein
MKSRGIVTVVLLLFVAACVAYLIRKEATGPADELIEPAPPTAAQEAAQDLPANDGPPPDHQVIAYYFHGAKRCTTCRAIEAGSLAALRDAYADQFADGRLVWRVVQYDTEENEHFIDEFGLFSASLVLVDMQDGEQQDWKMLDKVWQLVSDEDALAAYVRDEAGKYLETDA